MPTNQQEATNGRCKAMTKAGGFCAAPAMKGGQFCSLHADPGRAAELGRKGGMGNRHVYQDDGKEAPAPHTLIQCNLVIERAENPRGRTLFIEWGHVNLTNIDCGASRRRNRRTVIDFT